MKLLAWRPASLWQDPDFVKLWAGQAISKFGSHVGEAGIEFAALLALKATPAQMGLLGALRSAPVLAFGLVAGVTVDRLRRRPVLMAMDIARAILLASIPIAAALGALRIGQLYVVAALMGLFSLFFDVADAAFLPTVVPRERLVEGNSKISASGSLAEVAGPALGGTLVQWLTAPVAILVDAVSYLVSLVCIGLIRAPEPHPGNASGGDRQNVRADIVKGLRVITHNPVLRVLAACVATGEFFGSFFGVLYALYAVRVLHVSPAAVGISIGMGGAGALVGAVFAERVVRRVGLGRALIGSRLLSCGVQVSFLLAGLPLPVVLIGLMTTQFIGDIGWAIFAITEISVRQAAVPAQVLGRAHASMQVLTRAPGPIGAVVAGALATAVGPAHTLMIAYFGLVTSNLWLLSAPIRTLREPGDR